MSQQATRTLSVLATTPMTARVSASSPATKTYTMRMDASKPLSMQHSLRHFSSAPPPPPPGGGAGGMQLPPWMTGEAARPGELLQKYTTNLTQLAADGKLDPIIGRHEEIRRCLQVCSSSS